MVNVAINTLTASLHTTMADIQWVITGYLLAMSMTIPVSGWAVNRYGGKRMWLVFAWSIPVRIGTVSSCPGMSSA